MEFPELGKSLRLQDTFSDPNGEESVLKSRTWGDNWEVDGISEFEDQALISSKSKPAPSKKSTTEVVPFFVPNSGEARVIIGDQDVDNVSELSEEMSLENFSSDDDVIDASLSKTNEIISPTGLTLINAPADFTMKRGKAVQMTIEVQGEKPIGEVHKMSRNKLCTE